MRVGGQVIIMPTISLTGTLFKECLSNDPPVCRIDATNHLFPSVGFDLIFHQSPLSGQWGMVKPSMPSCCVSRLKHSQAKYVGHGG